MLRRRIAYTVPGGYVRMNKLSTPYSVQVPRPTKGIALPATLAGDDFRAPGVELLDFPPLWEGAPSWLNKPAVLAATGVLVVCALAWRAFARPQLVPRGLQNAGEYGYL